MSMLALNFQLMTRIMDHAQSNAQFLNLGSTWIGFKFEKSVYVFLGIHRR